jgi:hypothetical protein
MWLIKSKLNAGQDIDSPESRITDSGSTEADWVRLLNPVHDPHVKNGEQISVQASSQSPVSWSVRFAETHLVSPQQGLDDRSNM